MNGSRHKKVVIAGAGPSGLMMAAQLLRYGIQPFIIDSKDGPTSHSKALGVQARTLEIYRQMGIDEAALSAGIATRRLLFNVGSFREEFNFLRSGGSQTPFPFVFMLEQSKNERLLLDFLTQHACPVHWRTTLSSFTPDDNGATLILGRDRTAETVTCDWLIGADGAHSTVRKGLQIPFHGSAYQSRFYLADLVVENELDHHSIHLFLQNNKLAAAFPMKEPGRFRFIGVLPASLKDKDADLPLSDLEAPLHEALGFRLNVSSCTWTAAYNLHYRMAEHFSRQHCFLVGDAAHIHSPVGGQGMNTGLQDAYNLAWKLAGVINGTYEYRILETYSAERMPVAKSLLRSTDRVFNLIVTRNVFLRAIRNRALPMLLKKVLHAKRLLPRLFSMISQTAIAYRDSNLSMHHSQLKTIRAGDRLPPVNFFDEKMQLETDLHAWCAKPGFTLLILGKLKDRDLLTLVKWIGLRYPRNLNFYYLPLSPRNNHLFELFKVGEHGKKTLIIRPDMHIGYLNDIVDIDMIDAYFRNVVGWKKGDQRA